MCSEKTPVLWRLDPRLKTDTHVIVDNENEHILLMNDSRWLWLILVPKRKGAEELHDLSLDEQAYFLTLASQLGAGIKAMDMKQVNRVEKINIAALGNMVRQLHIHIVARHEGDANWPGPVWGFGKSLPYQELALSRLLPQLQNIVLNAQEKTCKEKTCKNGSFEAGH